MNKTIPKNVRVAIIGGGIAGCSLAYHLGEMGWKDVALFERKTLASGTSWHAAGLVTQLRNTRTLIDIARYGTNLYSRLEKETGYHVGFNQTGSITVAKTEGRLAELRKIASLGKSYGIDIEEISVRKAGEMWPGLYTEDLKGAIYIPKDGQTIPANTALAMARVAQDKGAKIFENVKVLDIETTNNCVSGLITDKGPVKCEYIVNAAGMWARQIGLMCGVNVPLYGAEHMYLVTNKINISKDMKSLRVPDDQIYFRRDVSDSDTLLMGGFETLAKPWGGDSIPEDYHFGLLDPDWEHFKIFWEAAIKRVPKMEQSGINRFYVSAESFTPDNNYLMGEAPEVKNFFVAAGLNSSGIAAGAGVGKAVAEWIVAGYPTMDLAEVDIARFSTFHNSPSYLKDRIKERVGSVYDMHWPHLQPKTARNVRKSPLHSHHKKNRACFGEHAGWERPNWYAPVGIEPKMEYSYGKQNWFEYSAREHNAVRNNVGLFDQTAFAKFIVEGNDAEHVLQNICANNVGVKKGTVVYTAMLNDRAGIEADVTVTRLEIDKYMIVTSSSTATRDMRWIKNNIPDGAHCFVTDVTSSYAVLGLMGPKSRELLSQFVDVDVSNEKFPYMTAQYMYLGYIRVLGLRVSYVGELGWELYIPVESAINVYENLIDKCNGIDIVHAGFFAMDSLRIEKGYRAWGTDIIDQDTPIEAGLGFAVDFSKPNFIGKNALLKQRGKIINKRLVMFRLDDPDVLLLGEEPIYRNGSLVGRTTSANFGHTLGCSVAMGYIECDDGVSKEYINTGSYQIELMGQKHSAKASLSPFYDPKGSKIVH